MSYEQIGVKYPYDGQVTEITIGPAPANIVSAKVIDELTTEIENHASSSKRSGTKLIVITGEGKHFSYGASVEEHKPELVGDMLPRLHGLITKIIECDVPTLARVSGLCLGGGFEVAMACSLIFCDKTAQFAVPEIQLGVFPPVASVLLPRLIAANEANRLILTGDKLPAEDALRLGLVSVMTDEGALEESTNKYIEKRFLPKSASSLRMACLAARADLARYFRENIPVAEKLYLEDLMSTSDAVEGIQSFLDKRPPEWKNA
jgi:cyclohexa-1,5-dienecarbonyl-CoA hydratase